MSFLFVDRLLQISSSSNSVRGIKHITRDDRYLCPDEQGRLCFMPSMIGETLGQLTAWAVMAACDFRKRPVAGIVAAAHLHHPAYVGDTLHLESWIDDLDDEAVRYHGQVHVGDTLVFQLESALGPMLPMQDFIDADTIRHQFAEVNRPGEWPLVSGVTSQVIPSNPRDVVVLNFDSVCIEEPGVRVIGIKNVTRSAPYFADHFPNKPVLPMTVLLECMTNLVQIFLQSAQWSGAFRIHSFQKIKMSDFVYPGDVLMSTMTVKHQDATQWVLHCRSEVAGKRVCVVDIVLGEK